MKFSTTHMVDTFNVNMQTNAVGMQRLTYATICFSDVTFGLV